RPGRCPFAWSGARWIRSSRDVRSRGLRRRGLTPSFDTTLVHLHHQAVDAGLPEQVSNPIQLVEVADRADPHAMELARVDRDLLDPRLDAEKREARLHSVRIRVRAERAGLEHIAAGRCD